MKILDSGGQSLFARVLERPWVTSIDQSDLAVGVVAVAVGTPATGVANTLFDLQNLSTLGQQIRIGLGVAPVFATTGKILNPGDNYSIVIGSGLGGTGDVQAIASAANGVLGRSIMST